MRTCPAVRGTKHASFPRGRVDLCKGVVAKVAPYFEGCANPCNGVVESGSLLTFATICTPFLEAKVAPLLEGCANPVNKSGSHSGRNCWESYSTSSKSFWSLALLSYILEHRNSHNAIESPLWIILIVLRIWSHLLRMTMLDAVAWTRKGYEEEFVYRSSWGDHAMRWHCVTIEDKHKIILHYGQKSSSGWNIYCRNECRYE